MKIRKYLDLIFLLSLLSISCDNSISNSDIIGEYGQRGDWYFKFDTTMNLKKYYSSSDIPAFLEKQKNENGPWNGIVYCEQGTGKAFLGLWINIGETNWGSQEIQIIWQRGGWLNLPLYRDGSWYFKKNRQISILLQVKRIIMQKLLHGKKSINSLAC